MWRTESKLVIRSLLRKENDIDEDELDYGKFFEGITIMKDRNNDNSGDDQDFDLEMNVAESDSDINYSIDLRWFYDIFELSDLEHEWLWYYTLMHVFYV